MHCVQDVQQARFYLFRRIHSLSCCWAFHNCVPGQGREHSLVSWTLLCPAWTQVAVSWVDTAAETESLCIHAIVKAVAQVQLVAKILLLLILLLVAGTTASQTSSKGSQLHTCRLQRHLSKQKSLKVLFKAAQIYQTRFHVSERTHAPRRLNCFLCTLFSDLNSDHV